ncbi:MAG: OmpA family protein [Bacteroidetes bacterium]|nr:OmpA family protein [Bacteroidota bacterium]
MEQFTEPVKLNSNINSPAEEGFPLISYDGKKMYFSRTFHPENTGGKLAGQDIWCSQADGPGSWTPASNHFPLINNKNNNVVIGQSRDGNILYLLNHYTSGNYMEFGLSAWDTASKEAPVKIDVPGLNIQSSYYGFYMHPDGEVLLISAQMEKSKGREDIYIALRDSNGIWQKPFNVGGAINSSGFEMSPYITDDLKHIYFASSGRGGKGGVDIFISARRGDNWRDWQPAKNMGNKINSRGFDAYFTIHNDQAYFCSNRDSEFSEIYSSRVISKKELEALLPKAVTVYFSLNSYIINAESKIILDDIVKLLKENKHLKVLVSGYTCRLGNEADNLKLAEMRSYSVSDYLQIYGIDDDLIATRTMGDKEAKKLDKVESIQKKFRKVTITFKNL